MYLISGASGLVGSHLMINLLKKGLSVKALYRNQKSIDKAKQVFSFYGKDVLALFESIQWVQGDLTNIGSIESALENVDYVYHCAAVVSFKKSDAEFLRKTNVEGTANLVNCCLNKGIKKFCHVSSTAAVGNPVKKELIHEGLPWKKDNYTSNYSVSKFQAEMEVWRGIEEGLNAVIVNPSIIIGPGDWNASSSELFQKVWKGLQFFTKGKNAFVDVRDVADCMVQLMDSDIRSERFLLISENWSYQQLFNCIADGLSKKHPSIEVKPWFLGMMWRIEAVRSFLFKTPPIITKETAHSSMNSREYNNHKVKEAIGFSFIPVEKSILDTCRIFLKSKTA